jgi:hypothetical protein
MRHEVHHVLVPDGVDSALTEVRLKVNPQRRLHGGDVGRADKTAITETVATAPAKLKEATTSRSA